MDIEDVHDYMPAWKVALSQECKSAETIKAYQASLQQYFKFCRVEGLSANLHFETVEAFLQSLVFHKASANTVRSRKSALRNFSSWLVNADVLSSDSLFALSFRGSAAEGGDALNEAVGIALLSTCSTARFNDQRDRAIIRLLIDTNASIKHIVRMTVSDVNPQLRCVRFRDGSNSRAIIEVSKGTARSLANYLMERCNHANHSAESLWLAKSRGSFGANALYKSLARRAAEAGISDLSFGVAKSGLNWSVTRPH
jgi:site-specific recombinase XerD